MYDKISEEEKVKYEVDMIEEQKFLY